MISTTILLIIVIVVASVYAWNSPGVIDKLIFNPYQIQQQRQYYRLIASGFIHSDWSHLIFNMFTLYFFGRNIEYFYQEIYGSTIGLLLYILLFLAGVGLSDVYALIKFKNSTNFRSLGASGGVAAIIYSAIIFSPLDKIYIFFIPIGIPGFIYAVLYLIYCSYADNRLQKNVNHSAHFWGSMVGVVFTVLVFPQAIPYFFQQIAQWRIF